MIILNILIKLQNIWSYAAYTDLLENKYTIGKCRNDLVSFIYYNINTCYIFFTIFVFMKLYPYIVKYCCCCCNCCSNTFFEENFFKFKLTLFLYISSNFNCVFSYYIFTNFKKKKHINENNIFINSLCKIFDMLFMNELSYLNNGIDFLNISGLIDNFNIIYDIIMLFISINIKSKTALWVQLFATIICFVMSFVLFVLFLGDKHKMSYQLEKDDDQPNYYETNNTTNNDNNIQENIEKNDENNNEVLKIKNYKLNKLNTI